MPLLRKNKGSWNLLSWALYLPFAFCTTIFLLLPSVILVTISSYHCRCYRGGSSRVRGKRTQLEIVKGRMNSILALQNLIRGLKVRRGHHVQRLSHRPRIHILYPYMRVFQISLRYYPIFWIVATNIIAIYLLNSVTSTDPPPIIEQSFRSYRMLLVSESRTSKINSKCFVGGPVNKR